MITSIILVIILISIFTYNYIRNTKVEKVRLQKKERNNAQKREYCKYLVDQISYAEKFDELFYLHKLAYSLGIKNKNLDADAFGMFRTTDIITMRIDEIFLGNINGLWTKTIPEWETSEDKDAVKQVFNQYKNLLISNIRAIEKGF